MSCNIHPTAVIDDKAQLGHKVTIGPYAIIEGQTEIGDNCQIDGFAQIKRFTSLGKDNHVHSYACLGGEPQDLKFHGEKTCLTIADGNCIREYVTINRGTIGGGGVTKIGSHCLIMAYAHIAHDCQIRDHVIMANAATLAGHVIVEDHAVVGGLSAVHQFVRIGEHAYIGGMTGVPQDVPPYTIIAGERGSLRGLNLIGLKRKGFNAQQISSLKKAFRILWRSGLKRQEALEKAKAELDGQADVLKLLEFIKNSERGVMSPKNR